MPEVEEPDPRAGTFERQFVAFMESKSGGTRGVYRQTLNRMRAFSPKLSTLSFEDVTYDWLVHFDRFLAETAPSRNARNIHFRNIWAVFNAVDLHRLREITPEGRVEYTRAKTHRLYSIKVEPEALEVINRYRGKRGLLAIADRWSNHRNFTHQINKALKAIGADKNRGGRVAGGAPKRTTEQARGLWPELSTY